VIQRQCALVIELCDIHIGAATAVEFLATEFEDLRELAGEEAVALAIGRDAETVIHRRPLPHAAPEQFAVGVEVAEKSIAVLVARGGESLAAERRLAFEHAARPHAPLLVAGDLVEEATRLAKLLRDPKHSPCGESFATTADDPFGVTSGLSPNCPAARAESADVDIALPIDRDAMTRAARLAGRDFGPHEFAVGVILRAEDVLPGSFAIFTSPNSASPTMAPVMTTSPSLSTAMPCP